MCSEKFFLKHALTCGTVAAKRDDLCLLFGD